MIKHTNVNRDDLRRLIESGEILFGGNSQLKIYGSLYCVSGKRMKRENRVFFVTEREAVLRGFRPCGKCMLREYRTWRDEII